jgi:hypothetical protein
MELYIDSYWIFKTMYGPLIGSNLNLLSAIDISDGSKMWGLQDPITTSHDLKFYGSYIGINVNTGFLYAHSCLQELSE